MPLTQKALELATNAIDKAERLLIIPHANVDPDGLSSALASYKLFSSLGKECTVLCPDTPPESLRFLPGFTELSQEIDLTQDFIVTLDLKEGVEVDKLQYTIEENKVNIIVRPKQGRLHAEDATLHEGPLPYDLVVVVDTAELTLLGSVYEQYRELFENVPVLNIDHHISNSEFGSVRLINPKAASATEVLYAWFTTNEDWNSKITADIATLLLTGLITDTRSFQNPNTTPHSLEIAAELLERGARQQEIIKFIYKTKPLSTLKIWGRALNNIQINEKEHVVWSALSREDLEEMEASPKETHGIIDELLTTIPNAQVYVLFTELPEGGLKASMRSSEAVDVSMLSSHLFNGGGHARAAGFRREGYDNFQLEVLDCIQKIIASKYGGQKDPKVHTAQQVVDHDEKEGTIDVVKTLSE